MEKITPQQPDGLSEAGKQFVKGAAIWAALNPLFEGMFGLLGKNGVGFWPAVKESLSTRRGWMGTVGWGLTGGIVTAVLHALFPSKKEVVVVQVAGPVHPPKEAPADAVHAVAAQEKVVHPEPVTKDAALPEAAPSEAVRSDRSKPDAVQAQEQPDKAGFAEKEAVRREAKAEAEIAR